MSSELELLVRIIRGIAQPNRQANVHTFCLERKKDGLSWPGSENIWKLSDRNSLIIASMSVNCPQEFGLMCEATRYCNRAYTSALSQILISTICRHSTTLDVHSNVRPNTLQIGQKLRNKCCSKSECAKVREPTLSKESTRQLSTWYIKQKLFLLSLPRCAGCKAR